MERESAIQDISYIKNLMTDTQKVLDISWPIYLYWGCEFLITAFMFPHIQGIKDWTTAPLISLIASIVIPVSQWFGYIFTAVYIFIHRKRLINKKMYLIGGVTMVVLSVGVMANLAGYFFRVTPAELQMEVIRQVFYKMDILLNGILLSTLLMILGLLYTREQFWIGFGLIFVTLFSLWLTVQNLGWFSTNSNMFLWIYLGVSFIIASGMAYRRHMIQVKITMKEISMERANAIQNISYIRQIMSETQQIMDIAWPVYIYWGIYFIFITIFRMFFSNVPHSFSIDTEHLTPADIKMLIFVLYSWIQVLTAWGGLFFSAFYIFRHRQRMFNKKMFLIGMLGLSFLLIYVTITISFDILWVPAPAERLLPLHILYNELIHGLYFSMIFIVFGLVYAREQLWMGYWMLIITIATIYMGSTQVVTDAIQAEMRSPLSSILFGNVGICFLIAGIMAYRRHKMQLKTTNEGE